MSRLGAGLALRGQAREIIFNVYQYLAKAKIENNLKYSVADSTSEATGVSVRFIYKIVKEGKSVAVGRQLFSTPKKNKDRQKKIVVDDFTKCVIRRKINDMYAIQKVVPTISILQKQLSNESILQCSTGYLHQLLKNMGYKWRRCQSQRKLLIERQDIVAARINFIRQINNFRSEQRPIIYVDETYIQASHSVSSCWQSETERGVLSQIGKGNRLIIVHGEGNMGFISKALLIFTSTSKSGDYHTSMNFANFSKWLKEMLIPNLPPNSVVVMDNAKYHCVERDKRPTYSTNKQRTMQWLRDHNVEVDMSITKAEMMMKLLDIPKEKKYCIDDILIESGHTPLHLPPYHPDLNPIELVWGDIKGEIARKTLNSNLNEKRVLAEKLFNEYSNEKWIKCCDHVVKIENEYKVADCITDNEIDRLIINLGEDSSTDEDNISDSE